jgi:uncharacterized protein (TIGR03435 family)
VSNLLIALTVALACNSLSAQSASPHRLAFDSVSIRPSAPEDAGVSSVSLAGGVTIRNTPLRTIITTLYDVDDRQLAGGPLWIDDEPFDIVATASSNMSAEELIRTAKAMLADRFQLSLRSAIRELPIYELTTARHDKRLGSGISRTARVCRGGRANERSACSSRVTPGSIASTGTTISAFAAKHLAPLVDRLIVDRTGIAGRFDVLLWFASDADAALRGTSAFPEPALLAAVEDQLGLRLRATSGSVPVFIVDRVERPINN